MRRAALSLLCLYSCLSLVAAQVVDPQLVGTWSTKSKQVSTGPGFYDAGNDRFKEPSLTGISYSFSVDGHYESAYYRSISNPTTPSCPKGVLQFQHGSYTKNADGSLLLTPIAVDGRQLISDPCKGNKAQYYRYNQTETFERYEVGTDTFHKVLRLNLYRFDGSPMQPMYLVTQTPNMLPTTTLHPLHTATGAAASGSGKRRVKRNAYDSRDTMMYDSVNKNAVVGGFLDLSDLDTWWWLGLLMTSVGGVMLLYSGN